MMLTRVNRLIFIYLIVFSSFARAENSGNRWLECVVEEIRFSGEQRIITVGYLIRYLENSQVMVESDLITYRHLDCRLSDFQIDCGVLNKFNHATVSFNRASGEVSEWYEPQDEKLRDPFGRNREGSCSVRNGPKF
jgi:hypothetical protein